MELQVNGARTYCYTGGKAFDATKPTVVFIHGVLNDHSVWILQSRSLAHHGYNVLAPDLPGHCKSAGAPPTTVEEGADFVLALPDARVPGTARCIGERARAGDCNGQHVLALDPCAAAVRARARHLAVRYVSRIDAARAGKQPRSQCVSHRLQGLQ